MSNVGIDAISFYVPEIFLPIKSLAEKRGIIYDKLNAGLGLEKMAVADINEDAATFCANALIALFKNNNLNPKDIGRIYLGTESAVDSSKPTATYAVEVLEKELAIKYGERSLRNCDVLDMTFACIGAVDAFQNSIDWVNCGDNRRAIVVASDVSKYELNSTGEYTQGAGAVALLISKNPSILAINNVWGVATKSENDFFKPRRSYKKSVLIDELINLFNPNLDKESTSDLLSESNFWNNANELIEVYKEEPIFDGQYSNACYAQRMEEALDHFKSQTTINFLNDWNHLIFHLPYAFHGRRILFNSWYNWVKENNKLDMLIDEIGKIEDDIDTWTKKAAKSKMYSKFIETKIAAGEKASTTIGNMYTASIFMSLLSTLSVHFENDTDIVKQNIGFIAYGSGSKAKVFEGIIQENWKSKIKDVSLFHYLNNRIEISISDYEKIHKNELEKPITNKNTRLIHKDSEINSLGYRRYNYNK
jgi:hydroxymethylglutaryl-CoA synthase